jgi:hypothetical protein
MPVIVTQDQVDGAWLRWRKFFKDSPRTSYSNEVSSWTRFEEFIGDGVNRFSMSYISNATYQISDEAARKLRMLLGPHHHAILTMYAIKANIPWK